LGAHIAQIHWQTLTTGVEVTDSTLKSTKGFLEIATSVGYLAASEMRSYGNPEKLRYGCRIWYLFCDSNFKHFIQTRRS